ncbi:unnamed protein product [Calypogeia fissa]
MTLMDIPSPPKFPYVEYKCTWVIHPLNSENLFKMTRRRAPEVGGAHRCNEPSPRAAASSAGANLARWAVEDIS